MQSQLPERVDTSVIDFRTNKLSHLDDDDDDDDDDEGELFCGLVLFLAGAVIRKPHHCESPARRKQDLNLS